MLTIDLNGKRVLLCGASQGIGAATAQVMAECGARLTLLARNEQRLAELCQTLPGGGHDWLAVDLGDGDQLGQSLPELGAGGYQILIHNSGGPPAGPVIEADPAAFEAGFRQHLVAGQRLAQALVPSMRSSGWGRIVNVISTSVREPIVGLGVSNAVRGAVAAWSKTLSRELAADNITVNNVLPGFTETPRLASLIAGRMAKQGLSEDEVRAAMLAQVPLGRFCQPEDTAAAIAFLCSSLADCINGVSLPVDGGRLASL